MDYTVVNELLLQEAYKIGGEIFSEEANKLILEEKAKEGDEDAKDILGKMELTKSIFGTSSFLDPNLEEKRKKMITFLTAINVLEKASDDAN